MSNAADFVPTGSVPRGPYPRNGTYSDERSIDEIRAQSGAVRRPAVVSAADTQVGGSFYKDMKVEPWAACEAWMTPEQFQGHLLASAIQYLSRFNVKEEGKGGIKDVRKAHHYLAKLIEVSGG